MVDTSSPAQLRAVRAELVACCARLLDDGLAIGTAGNLSVRLPGGEVAITPSGVGYRDLRPGDICLISPTGHRTARAGQELAVPSSEAPMHLAIYAATAARAIVHTHSAEVIALSAGCDELPAIHYAITGLGGPVRVAPYARFGSDELAGAAARALTGRQAVSCATTARSAAAGPSPRPTTGPCCWNGWPGSTAWPARMAHPAS